MNTFPLRIDSRGRITLPAALRRASEITVGQDVIAVVDGDGRITISTSDGLIRQLRETCARMGSCNGTSDLRRWRKESEAERLHRLEHPRIDPKDAARRGRELLVELGLA